MFETCVVIPLSSSNELLSEEEVDDLYRQLSAQNIL